MPTSKGRAVCALRCARSALPMPCPCLSGRTYACRISATSLTCCEGGTFAAQSNPGFDMCCMPITPTSSPPSLNPPEYHSVIYLAPQLFSGHIGLLPAVGGNASFICAGGFVDNRVDCIKIATAALANHEIPPLKNHT